MAPARTPGTGVHQRNPALRAVVDAGIALVPTSNVHLGVYTDFCECRRAAVSRGSHCLLPTTRCSPFAPGRPVRGRPRRRSVRRGPGIIGPVLYRRIIGLAQGGVEGDIDVVGGGACGVNCRGTRGVALIAGSKRRPTSTKTQKTAVMARGGHWAGVDRPSSSNAMHQRIRVRSRQLVPSAPQTHGSPQSRVRISHNSFKP